VSGLQSRPCGRIVSCLRPGCPDWFDFMYFLGYLLPGFWRPTTGSFVGSLA
jgi:hypothetical protein